MGPEQFSEKDPFLSWEAEARANLTRASEAQKQELYRVNVDRFWRRLMGKLIRHNALNNGFGWACFSSADNQNTDVLIASEFVPDERGQTYGKQRIRIVANEIIDCGVDRYCISRDVIITNDGSIFYMVDSMIGEGGSLPEDEVSLVNADSLASVFWIEPKDSTVLITSQFEPVISCAYDCSDNTKVVIPFGLQHAADDKNYALHQAFVMLEDILELDPNQQLPSPANN